MELVFSLRLFLCLEHFFLLPYYDWLERDKSSASVGTVFHTFRFFVHQNIGKKFAPPPTSIDEKIRFGISTELYFVLFIYILTDTQFVQATAILFAHTSCVEVTERTNVPVQKNTFVYGIPARLTWNCKRLLFPPEKFNARLSNISLSSILNTAENAH